MRTLEELKELVACGKGEIPCDWKLANVQLVNVYSREIYPTDIYVKGKRIVSIEPGSSGARSHSLNRPPAFSCTRRNMAASGACR